MGGEGVHDSRGPRLCCYIRRNCFLPKGDDSKFVFGVGGVGHRLSCPPQGPGGMQVQKGRQISASPSFSKVNDTLQSTLILAVAVVHQMMMKEVTTDLMVEV